MTFTEELVAHTLERIFSQVFSVDIGHVEGLSMRNLETWNSLTHMELIVQISGQFGLGRLPVDDIVALNSFDNVKKYICLRLGIEGSYEPK